MKKSDFRELLDQISTCFIQGDFETWEARVLLPFSMVTQDGPVILNDRSELKSNFDLYLEACKILNLDKIYPKPISLENCEDGTWIGTYETSLMNGNIRAARPYTSSVSLHEFADGWKMSAILNARGHHEWTSTTPGQENQSDT